MKTRVTSIVRAALCLILPAVSWAQSSAALQPQSSVQAACARACLKKFVDDYATSMLKKDVASVPVAANVKVTENTRAIKLGEGVWLTANKFFSTPSSTQYVADPESGQIARMGIIDDAGKPAFWTVRLKIAGNRIIEIETLLTHEGEAGPFQPEGYLWREAPFIREIPMAIRSSRAELLKTAGTYWSVATGSHRGGEVPYSVDCVHVENGMNTDWERPLDNIEAMQPTENPQSLFDGRIWTCEREVNLTTRSFAAVRGLRYLVDEERGLVMAWNIVDKVQPVPGAAPAGGPPPGINGIARTAPEYGPQSRGADGWPAQRGGFNPAGAGATPTSTPALYHAALVRIVNGRIHREQFFQVNVPVGTASPW